MICLWWTKRQVCDQFKREKTAVRLQDRLNITVRLKSDSMIDLRVCKSDKDWERMI